jgi:hypothetical protein
VAVLEVGHSFFQRLGTLGGYLVTEKGDLRSPEDALCWVDDDPISHTALKRPTSPLTKEEAYRLIA